MEKEQLIYWQENLKKREIENDVLGYIGKPFIVVILGSRQVGKTSLLRRLIGDLVLQKKVDPRQILYFDFEIIADAEAFSKVTPEAVERVISSYGAKNDRDVYLFIDEIQYHQNPSNLLKVIFDHLPNVHLVVSGSSTLRIKEKFKDSLAGRHKTFILPTLSFLEFLDFKKRDELKCNLKDQDLAPRIKEELRAVFEEYIVFGGYPKVVLSTTEDEKISAIESIFTSYVRRDIKDLAVIGEVEKFNKLISLLAFQIGNIVNLSELSSSSGLNQKTLEKYLFLLENTFIIELVKPYFTNRRKEIVKSPKVYFLDSGLRNYVVNNFSSLEKRTDTGPLFENAIFSLLKSKGELRYWRSISKLEVDFIRITEMGKPIPYEAKYKAFKKAQVSSGLRSFIDNYQPKMAFVITRGFFGKMRVKKTEVLFLPAWAV